MPTVAASPAETFVMMEAQLHGFAPSPAARRLVEKRLSLLEEENQRHKEDNKRRQEGNELLRGQMRLLGMENERLRFKMEHFQTKVMRGPAVFTVSKDEVLRSLASGIGLDLLNEGIPILGFLFGVTLYPFGDGSTTSWDRTPLPEDGCIPMVEVWVRRTPDLGPDVPQCVGLRGEVTLSGVKWGFGISKFHEEAPLTAPTWASCGIYDFDSVKSSSLLDQDPIITVSISKLVLQDGTVLS